MNLYLTSKKALPIMSMLTVAVVSIASTVALAACPGNLGASVNNINQTLDASGTITGTCLRDGNNITFSPDFAVTSADASIVFTLNNIQGSFGNVFINGVTDVITQSGGGGGTTLLAGATDLIWRSQYTDGVESVQISSSTAFPLGYSSLNLPLLNSNPNHAQCMVDLAALCKRINVILGVKP